MTRVKQTIRRWRRIRADKARFAAQEEFSLSMHVDGPRVETSDEDMHIDPAIMKKLPTRIRPT